MFGLGALDDKERELREQGRSLKIGLWSFLFTGRPEDDRQFFDLYSEHIDRTAGEDWHCIGFAKKENNGWRADKYLHAISQNMRGAILNHLIKPWDCSIVFFNPFNLAQNGSGVVIPLDGRRLSNEELFKEGIDAVIESVRESRGADLNRMDEEYGIDERLRVLKSTLTKRHFKGIGTAVFDRSIGPALSRLFGK